MTLHVRTFSVCFDVRVGLATQSFGKGVSGPLQSIPRGSARGGRGYPGVYTPVRAVSPALRPRASEVAGRRARRFSAVICPGPVSFANLINWIINS